MLKVFRQLHEKTVCTEAERVKLYKVIDEFILLVQIARREGILALEDVVKELDSETDYFLKTGLMFVVDGTDPKTVEGVLETLILAYDGSERKGTELLKLIIQADGILSIQAGENPRILREKLSCYFGLNFISNSKLMAELQQDVDGTSKERWSLHHLGVKLAEYMDSTDKANSKVEINKLSNEVIVGIMLSCDVEVAADVLALLPVERQAEIVKKMMDEGGSNTQVLVELFEDLRKLMVNKGELTFLGKKNRAECIANVLFAMGKRDETRLVNWLEDNGDNLLADEIGGIRFNFDVLAKLSDSDLQLVICHADFRDLVLACKGASFFVVDKIQQNLSAGKLGQFKQDSDDLGPIRRSDMEECQNRVLNVVRQLEDVGEITIPRRRGMLI